MPAREGRAEGPHLPHRLIPVTPEPLPDALHAELELLQAVVPDHPAVVRLLARRRRDEVMGWKTGKGQAGLGSAAAGRGPTRAPSPAPHAPLAAFHAEGICQSRAGHQSNPTLNQLLQNLLLGTVFPSSHPSDPVAASSVTLPSTQRKINQLFKICQVSHK